MHNFQYLCLPGGIQSQVRLYRVLNFKIDHPISILATKVTKVTKATKVLELSWKYLQNSQLTTPKISSPPSNDDESSSWHLRRVGAWPVLHAAFEQAMDAIPVATLLMDVAEEMHLRGSKKSPKSPLEFWLIF